MSDTLIFAGRVVKRPLPVVPAPCPPDAPAGRRLFLAQGELAQFYDAEEPIRYIAFIELREGKVRGNHYHNIKEEHIYVIEGELELAVADLASGERVSLRLVSGDLAIVRPGIAHALRTLGRGKAIEFSKTRYDAADVHAAQVL